MRRPRSASTSATRPFMRGPAHLPAAFHIGPKLMWLKVHEPESFGRASHALQPRDLVAHALTGEIATDGTHAAATLAFDLHRRAWADDLIDAMGLPRDLFPAVRPSAEPVGGLLAAVARRVGLDSGIPVILGGADSQACALGAGVIAAGPVSEMAGSSTCLNAAVTKPLTRAGGDPLPARHPGAVHHGDGHQHDGGGHRLDRRPAVRAPRPACRHGRLRAPRPRSRIGAGRSRWGARPPGAGGRRTDRSGPARRLHRDLAATRPSGAGAGDDGGRGVRDSGPAGAHPEPAAPG